MTDSEVLHGVALLFRRRATDLQAAARCVSDRDRYANLMGRIGVYEDCAGELEAALSILNDREET